MMPASGTIIYTGSYTEGTGSEGAHAFRVLTDGALSPLGCVARATNPAYLCLDRQRMMLYAVEETFANSATDGAILAYHVIPDSGGLSYAGRVSSGGVGPCHLAITANRRSLLFANYHGGSVGSVRLSDEGALDGPIRRVMLSGRSVHPQRQTMSHPHAIVPCFADHCAIVAEIGRASCRERV